MVFDFPPQKVFFSKDPHPYGNFNQAWYISLNASWSWGTPTSQEIPIPSVGEYGMILSGTAYLIPSNNLLSPKAARAVSNRQTEVTCIRHFFLSFFLLFLDWRSKALLVNKNTASVINVFWPRPWQWCVCQICQSLVGPTRLCISLYS